MPKFEIRERIGCTKKMHVEVERERVDQEISITLKNLKKEIQIPGFRKGKAPESLIAKRFSATIREEAVKELVPKVLKEMFDSESINPVGDPAISDFVFEETGPLTFTVAVEEIPEIDVTTFDKVTVTKEIAEVTDEDIDGTIDRIRHMRAVRNEVNREAHEGDILAVNLLKLDPTGVPLIGEKKEQRVLNLEKENISAYDWLSQLLGIKKGEERKVRITYENSSESGEQTTITDVYNVEVLQVIENIIPELNDEFAKSLGEYADLMDFRTRTREHLENQAELNAERKLRADLVDEFIKQNPFEVPGSMVTRVLSADYKNIRKDMPDREIDEKEYFNKMRPDAVRAVQSYLVTDKIKKEAGIDVTREELAEELELLAVENNMDPKDFRRRLIKDGRLDEVKNDIAQRKAYEWMVKTAKVTVVKTKKNTEKSNIIIPNRRT
ncbi:trigger factor [bacterium]|nr:trigger factor [bacterium]